MPFLTTDLAVCPAPLPMMASGGECSKCTWGGGGPSHDGHHIVVPSSKDGCCPRLILIIGQVGFYSALVND
jgi:hypothetical protein